MRLQEPMGVLLFCLACVLDFRARFGYNINGCTRCGIVGNTVIFTASNTAEGCIFFMFQCLLRSKKHRAGALGH